MSETADNPPAKTPTKSKKSAPKPKGKKPAPKKTPKPKPKGNPKRGKSQTTQQSDATPIEPVKPKVGRPSLCTEELTVAICARVANGESIHKICRDPDMPARSCIAVWVAQGGPFTDRYARARDAAAHLLCSELIDIADDSSQDYIQTEDGRRKFDGENVQRSKVMIETRKWVISKLLPQYADRLDTNISAKVEVTNTKDGDLELARFCDKLAMDNIERVIDRRVAEGKLIRVDAPLQHRHQRQLPSPSHAPGAPVIDLVAEPVTKPEPKELTYAAYQRSWYNGNLK